jgi:CheY-like chemotaxis protein
MEMTTVLVVDDSAADRRLAGGLLERRDGWNVIYAVDGGDAIEQIELHLPDAVLTDMQMPNVDGLALVNRIKEEYPLVPVVLMTVKGSEEIAVRALEAGAASYVPKRTLAGDLVDTVEQILASSTDERHHSRLLNRIQRQECEFVLENELGLIRSAVQYLQEMITQVRLCDEPERLRVGVALEEALINAFYHGNLKVSSKLREQSHEEYYGLAKQRMLEAPYCDRRIHIQAGVTRERATYVIRDEGPGFDPASLPNPTDPVNIDRPCGRAYF